MIEVFQTNVENQEQAGEMLSLLSSSFPGAKMNFDLDDCDRILRVEGNVRALEIIEVFGRKGYLCRVLES